jgi:hypothetical protein
MLQQQTGASSSPATAPEPASGPPGQTDQDCGAVSRKDRSKPWLPVPRWLFNLFGHAIAAILGLAIGYVILHQIRPASFPLPW